MKHRREADEKTLASVAGRALGWSFFNTAFSRIGTLGIGILLARLLGPTQFGDAAVALVALLAILSFNELGVSLAIVRWPGEPDEIAPTVLTISVAMSVLLYAVFYFVAPAFSAAMHAPAAAPVVRVMALMVVIDGFVATPAALMERYFRQAKKTIADQVHNWLSAGLSVGLAWAGFGAMSLAIGQVAGSLAGGILLIIFAPLPFRFGFSLGKARQLLRFGLPLAGSSMVVFLVGNADNFIVGRVLGATVLGYYVLAWNLASWPVNIFSQPVRTVAPAMFSRLQRDQKAMRTSFTAAASLLGAVTFPICLLISGAAVPIIGFVYGPRWAPAAQALVWLAMLGGLRILFELTYDYFVVLAKSRVVFIVQVVWLAALVPVLIVGARLDGVRGVAIGGFAVAGLVVLPWYLIELSRVGVKLRSLVAGLWLPVVGAAGAGFAAAWASRVIPNDLAACALGGVVSLALVGLLVYRMLPTLGTLRGALSGAPEPIADTADSRALERAAVGAGAPARKRSSHARDPAAQLAALELLMAMSAPNRSPARPSYFVGLPASRDYTAPIPIYRETVASERLDPASAGNSARWQRRVPVDHQELHND
jgi:O-antigen/teichoic acid export membrane protein